MISEVIALRINEEVAGQLHSGLISITDDHQDRLHRMETHIEGLEKENAHLKESIICLSKGLADVRMQSVMCHAMLMHYVETHWEPIGHLFGQIAALSGCGIVPPTGSCSCDVINELFNSQGVDGPGTPSSLPSLESQPSSVLSRASPSPIDSVYYTPAFLLSSSGAAALSSPPEGIPFVVVQGRLTTPPALSPTFPGDSGLSGSLDQGGIFEVGFEGLPLPGNEGWFGRSSDGDAVDLVAGRD